MILKDLWRNCALGRARMIRLGHAGAEHLDMGGAPLAGVEGLKNANEINMFRQ